MQHIYSVIQSFISLVYPMQCVVCSGEVFIDNSAICPICLDELPYTYFEQSNTDHPMDRMFYGRLPTQFTYALLFFEQNGPTQPILHALKYGARRNVGKQLGERIAYRIAHLHSIEPIDALIPVPIHPKKAFTRGYNQSEFIAKGVGAVLHIPVQTKWVVKCRATESQTRKSRFLRWDNVADQFESRINGTFAGHIAIVDDVLTTGATIEAVVKSIRSKNEHIRISIITLAITT